jgi:hypothetical protein
MFRPVDGCWAAHSPPPVRSCFMSEERRSSNDDGSSVTASAVPVPDAVPEVASMAVAALDVLEGRAVSADARDALAGSTGAAASVEDIAAGVRGRACAWKAEIRFESKIAQIVAFGKT